MSPEKSKQGLQLSILPFATPRGNRYVYDDVTGMVFAYPEVMSEILNRYLVESIEEIVDTLVSRYPERDIHHYYRLVDKWNKNHGAFYRDIPSSSPIPEPSPPEISTYLTRHGFKELLLNVTESCNLRCAYCVFSSAYPDTFITTKRMMSQDTAFKAVDYYLGMASEVIKRNPYSRPVIGFYGGEPLLNLSLIKSVIEHVKETCDCEVFYTITTNGTLLNDEAVDYLVTNEVSICLSLDGPPEEHDRLRIFADGKGSANQVIRNIKRFRQRYPAYQRTLILSTYDWGTSLKKVNEFFSSEGDKLPFVAKASPVSPLFTNYYDRYDGETVARFRQEISELRDLYRNRIIAGDLSANRYLDALIGSFPRILKVRSVIEQPQLPYLPCVGACVPGDKIFVDVDGDYHICEKMNPNFPIGNVETGLDTEKICDVITGYQNAVLSKCRICPISRICFGCYFQFAANNKFCSPAQNNCSQRISTLREELSYAYSILEENQVAFQEMTDNHYEKLGWYDMQQF